MNPELYKDRNYLFALGTSLKYDRRKFKIFVNKDSIFKDSFSEIERLSQYHLTYWYSSKTEISVEFLNELSLNSKECLYKKWLSLLIESFFIETNNGNVNDFTAPVFLRLANGSTIYAPSNYYTDEVYIFVGSILAEGLKHGISIKYQFIESFYRFLLDIEPYRSEDFAIQNPVAHNNHMILKTNSRSGALAREMHNLSLEDVSYFVHNIVRMELYFDYTTQLHALEKGFTSRLNAKLTPLFNVKSLKIAIRGPDSVENVP